MCFFFYPATMRKLQNENVECRPPYAMLVSVMLKETMQALKSDRMREKSNLQFIKLPS